jgi:hypothetical protein
MGQGNQVLRRQGGLICENPCSAVIRNPIIGPRTLPRRARHIKQNEEAVYAITRCLGADVTSAEMPFRRKQRGGFRAACRIPSEQLAQ